MSESEILVNVDQVLDEAVNNLVQTLENINKVHPGWIYAQENHNKIVDIRRQLLTNLDIRSNDRK